MQVSWQQCRDHETAEFNSKKRQRINRFAREFGVMPNYSFLLLICLNMIFPLLLDNQLTLHGRGETYAEG